MEAGVVNIPVPIILLTMREKTSNHVSPGTSQPLRGFSLPILAASSYSLPSLWIWISIRIFGCSNSVVLVRGEIGGDCVLR